MIKQLVVIFLFSIITILMFSQIHEITHYQIGKYYGCQGEIQWDFLDVNKSFVELSQGK